MGDQNVRDEPAHAMKSKLKIIIITFVTTTAFWCLLIAGLFWWVSRNDSEGRDFLAHMADRGYVNAMAAWNHEKTPVTFTVSEILNATNTNFSESVLVERQLPPLGSMWIGISKKEPTNK